MSDPQGGEWQEMEARYTETNSDPVVAEIMATADGAARRGALEEAIAILREGSLKHPTPQLFASLGRRLRFAQRYHEAIETLQAALFLDQSHFDMLCELGLNQLADGDTEGALATHSLLLLKHPENPEARCIHAMTRCLAEQPERGLATLIELTEQHPDSIRFRFSKAHALVIVGRFREACAILEEMGSHFPNLLDAWRLLTEARYELLQREAWSTAARRAYELNPRAAQTQFWMARVHLVAADVTSAEACLTRALEINPRYVPAHVEFGGLCWFLGQQQDLPELIERAQIWFESAVAINPRHDDACGRLAQFYLATGRGTVDLDALELQARQYSHSHLPRLAGHVFLAQVRDYERAARLLKLAVERRSEDVEGWQLLGQALGMTGQHEEAVTAFRRALELYPEFGEAWDNLGVMLLELHRSEEAVAALKRARQYLPHNEAIEQHYQSALMQAGLS